MSVGFLKIEHRLGSWALKFVWPHDKAPDGTVFFPGRWLRLGCWVGMSSKAGVCQPQSIWLSEGHSCFMTHQDFKLVCEHFSYYNWQSKWCRGICPLRHDLINELQKMEVGRGAFCPLIHVLQVSEIGFPMSNEWLLSSLPVMPPECPSVLCFMRLQLFLPK